LKKKARKNKRQNWGTKDDTLEPNTEKKSKRYFGWKLAIVTKKKKIKEKGGFEWH